MALVPSRLQGFERPGERVGVTRWRQLLAADIVAQADPNTLLGSITDTSGEIVCTASTLGGGTATPSQCFTPRWALTNPDTGVAVDWSDGDYLSVQVWIKFGTNFPSAAREAFYLGIGNASSNDVLMAGLYMSGSTTKLASSTWSASDKNTVTWANTDNVLYGEQVVAPLVASSNVLISNGFAFQLDDATTPARISHSLAGSLTQAAATSLQIMASFSGNIDVACYYRLAQMPPAPT